MTWAASMCGDCGLHHGLFADIDAEQADDRVPWKIWDANETTRTLCESPDRRICKEVVQSLSARGRCVILESPNGREYYFRPVTSQAPATGDPPISP
jgi:hypothetical protein